MGPHSPGEHDGFLVGFGSVRRCGWVELGSTCMFRLSIDMKDCSDNDESGGAYGYKVEDVAEGSRGSSQTVTNVTMGCQKVIVYRE